MNTPAPCRPPAAVIAGLRAAVARFEGAAQAGGVLPFGIAALDSQLGGGLAAALHEIAGGTDGAATLFAAGIAARTAGAVLWCAAGSDVFAPGLAQAGLMAARVIHVAAADNRAVLACMEEALRHGGLGAVIGEVAALPLPAARRLQLAAQAGGTLCLALRRQSLAGGQPTAAATRWRVTPLPSMRLPVPGVGRGRWRVELLRARAGGSCSLELEACDGSGHLAVPAAVADRPLAAQRAAAG